MRRHSPVKKPTSENPPSLRRKRSKSLEELVARYLADGNACDDGMAFYREPRTRREAFRRAVLSRKLNAKGKEVRHDHQRKIGKKLLHMAFEILLRADLEGAESFHELFLHVRRLIGGVKGIGEVVIYDVSHRIGAWMQPRLRPKYVYLHAGTREGARELGLDFTLEKLAMSDLPAAMHQLRAEEVEDFLCRCRGELAPFAKFSGRSAPAKGRVFLEGLSAHQT